MVDSPSFGRDGAGPMEDVAADGVVFRAVGDFYPQLFLDIDDRHLSVDDPAASRQDGKLGLLADVVFIGDFPHKLLEDVLNRDDPFGPSPFVDDDGQVDLFAAEFLQKLGNFFRLRGVEDRFDELADRGVQCVWRLLDVNFQNIFVEEHTGDVVDAVFVNGDAAVAFGEKTARGLMDRGVFRHAENVDPGDHDFAGDPLFEGDHR